MSWKNIVNFFNKTTADSPDKKLRILQLIFQQNKKKKKNVNFSNNLIVNFSDKNIESLSNKILLGFF